MDLTLTSQLIRNSVQEAFGVSKTITTSMSNIVKLVVKKHPQISIEQVKTAMANIEGWRTSSLSVTDQIEITPQFFNQ